MYLHQLIKKVPRDFFSFIAATIIKRIKIFQKPGGVVIALFMLKAFVLLGEIENTPPPT